LLKTNPIDNGVRISLFMELVLSLSLNTVSVIFYTWKIQNPYILSLIITAIIIIIVIIIIITTTSIIIIYWRNILLDTIEKIFLLMLKMCYDLDNCFVN